GILFETGMGNASLWLFAFGPVRSDLLLHVFGVPVPTDDELLHGLFVEIAIGFDCGGFEEPDEFGERLLLAVVRGGAGQDEGIGVLRQGVCQAVVEGVRVRDVVGFV